MKRFIFHLLQTKLTKKKKIKSKIVYIYLCGLRQKGRGVKTNKQTTKIKKGDSKATRSCEVFMNAPGRSMISDRAPD